MFHSISLPRTDLSHLAGKPVQALAEIFGFKDLRSFQLGAIEAFSRGDDAFVFAATGGGKSLCYQLPAIVSEGLTVVVSPLIALMRDQADGLRRRGVPAAALAGGQALDVRERVEIETAIRAGGLKLLLVSPERLSSPAFLSLLEGVDLSLIAIDEAHCVSQWGHDFRPDYLKLPEFLDRFPSTPRMALTASASLGVQDEIMELLLRRPCARIVSSTDRENLFLQVVDRVDDGTTQLHELLAARRAHGASIVYCRTRAQADQVAANLLALGHRAASYHAGIDPQRRSRLQDAFLKAPDAVMVATTAFGMGVDKPDVATVAHLSLPDSMEAYYQESGRAGRDGRSALAWMAWAPKDAAHKAQQDVQAGLRDAAALEVVMSYVEAARCRRNAIMNVFGQRGTGTCGQCDLCLSDRPVDDVGEDARVVLALISDHQGSAGAIAEALAGERTDRVLSLGLQAHPSFAVFEMDGAKVARRMIRRCISEGLVEVDRQTASISISNAGYDVLLGDAPVEMRPVRGPRIARRASNGEGLPEEARALLRRLEACRSEHASRRGVQPSALLSDARLVQLLSTRDASSIEDLQLRVDIEKAMEIPGERPSATTFDTGLFG